MPTPSDLSARAAAILAALRELERVCEEAPDDIRVCSDADGMKFVCHPGGDTLARHCASLQAFESCGEELLAFVVAARTALPVLVRIGIAEVERAQHELELVDTVGGSGWECDQERAGHAYRAGTILGHWSAILPQPKEGESR